jgi:hypothetical protein
MIVYILHGMNNIHIYNKKQEDSRESKESSVEKTRVSVKRDG